MWIKRYKSELFRNVLNKHFPYVDKYFTPFLEKGIDILYLACSSALSGSVNVFELAKEELLMAYYKSVNNIFNGGNLR